MLRGAAFVLVVMATSAWADTAPQPQEVECTSCTARHKALQKLQEARLTPPADETQPDDAAVDAKDD